MTEQVASGAYSKDYWDLVGGQLARRPSVRVASVLLVLLYALSIFAPFLANDRPLYFRGTDYGSYRGAWRVIGNACDDLLVKARGEAQGFVDWAAAREAQGAALEGEARQEWQATLATAPQTYRDWLEVDRRSLELRLESMRRQLAPKHHALLDQCEAAAGNVLRAAVAGDQQTLAGAATALLASSRAVHDQLRPAHYDEPAEAGHSVALVPMTLFPVIDSLSWGEVYFMLLWVLVLLLPIWNRLVNRFWLRGDRQRMRAARRPKLLAVLLVPALAVLGWEVLHGATANEFQPQSFKEALSAGKARAEQVLFPPIAFGSAEQHDGEQFRPPTWDVSAQLDARGFYAGETERDAEGRAVHRTPVDVRVAEAARNAPLRHALGTDSLGRDLLARMIWGGRISLSVGLISSFLLVLIGTILGSLAGYFGGWIDVLISRVIEVFQCFPVFFLILIVVSFLGPSVINIMLAIGIFRWTGVARLVRGEFIRLRGLDFVVASEGLGARGVRTIFRHVLPNAMGPVLVAATFAVASGILTESALSFLGFGVKLPIPSWGSLLNESRSPSYWWIQVFPGLAVFVTVILYNLVGEGIRDALDPRLKEA